MSYFLQLVLDLAIILIAAKTAGYVSNRLGQPSVLGEIIVGIILGPSLIDVLHFPFFTDQHLPEIIMELGELGVMLLMFIAGLELHLSELAQNTKASALTGTLGVVLPVGLGWTTGIILGMDSTQAAFLGLTLGATSVSISAQTLMELNVLKSKVGLGLLGAAVFDDILVILLLSAFLALIGGGGTIVQILIILIRMIVYLSLASAVGIWILPWLVDRLSKLPISQITVTFAIITMLIFGLTAEIIGEMAAITGSFLAGLMFARTPYKRRIEEGFNYLSYGLFVPIFFVSIGMGINLKEINPQVIWASLLFIAVAIFGKLIGAGLGARLGNFTWKESIQIGIGMISRGEVGLIVAKVGSNANIISTSQFSIIIAVVVVSTLITPPLLRLAFKSRKVHQTEPEKSHSL